MPDTRQLPDKPDLDQLRTQARELLNAFRAGEPAAVAEVHAHYHNADSASFRLSDAQLTLARAYGFASWPKLKAFVDGVTIGRFHEAVRAGDIERVRAMIRQRPELVQMDAAGNDEHRALHYAVLARDQAMTRLLMEAGADARKGIFPHRDATTAFAIARDRGYTEISAVIEEGEQRRRAAMTCPNTTVSPIQDQITEAIRRGDNSEAIRVLEADPSLIGACDRNSSTPLHAAAGAANEVMVAWLIDKGASPCRRDGKGLAPLDHAAMAVEQFATIAKRLLEAGAEITVRGATALADEAQVRELVSRAPGVLREVHWSRGGLLSLAVNHGHIEMVRLLLDLGADPDERTLLEELEDPTVSWGTPLWHAAQNGRTDIARLLLDRGADPNANVYASGWPLRNAWQRRDEPMKRLLLERGAKPQPYMVAEAHDVEGARRLLAADDSEGLAQELAWAAAVSGCPSVLELALPRLRWSADDPRWHWILIQPMRGLGDGPDPEGYFRCMALLLDAGVDANVAQRFGQRPLHYAAARGGLSESDRVRFAAMLLDHGARLDVRDDLLRSTPLGWACRWGRVELVDLLIARGAAVDEPDAEDWATPLAWARKMHHVEIERFCVALRR